MNKLLKMENDIFVLFTDICTAWEFEINFHAKNDHWSLNNNNYNRISNCIWNVMCIDNIKSISMVFGNVRDNF